MASSLIAAIWVAKTSSCSSRMFVTFSWKAKYSSLFYPLFIVLFIAFTSSLTFFLLSSLKLLSSASISSIISLSTEVSCLVAEVFLLVLLLFFWAETEPTTFLTEVDLLPFLAGYSVFFWLYSFFILTPELLDALGGALFAGMLAFWLLIFFDYYFFMFFAEFIFYRCYFENSALSFLSMLSLRLLFYSTILLYISFNYELSFRRSAYLSVLRLWSAEELPGEMQAIITTFDLSCLAMNESLRIRVSFDALKGTWSALSPIALIHYFKANKLLLISAPSILLCLLLLWVSWAL